MLWSNAIAYRARFRVWLDTRVKSDTGASLIEYALLLGLIAVVAITALAFLGGTTSNLLNNAGNEVNP
jgi:Flp pilus assembly pilin Flp